MLRSFRCAVPRGQRRCGLPPSTDTWRESTRSQWKPWQAQFVNGKVQKAVSLWSFLVNSMVNLTNLEVHNDFGIHTGFTGSTSISCCSLQNIATIHPSKAHADGRFLKWGIRYNHGLQYSLSPGNGLMTLDDLGLLGSYFCWRGFSERFPGLKQNTCMSLASCSVFSSLFGSLTCRKLICNQQ